MSVVVAILRFHSTTKEESNMAAPNDTSLRCTTCGRPATSTAEIRVGRRVLRMPLCPQHRRDLLRGARRLRT